MTTREQLRHIGNEIIHQLGHGINPPQTLPAQTPDMQKYTTEFIFGAVWGRPGLDIRYRMLITLSILSSLQRLQQLRTYINSALNLGLDSEEIREVFIHCSIYAGFPTTSNSLELAQEVFEQRGVTVPTVKVPEVSLEEMEARGRSRRQELMGNTDHGGYVSAIDTQAPDLRKLSFQYGFGELYYRPGLDLKSRVACTIAALVAIHATPQLHNFLKAGLKMGFSKEEIIEMLIQTGPYAGFPAAINAVAIAHRVLTEAP